MAERIKFLPIPDYSRAEETFNTASHEIGVYLSAAGFYFLLIRALLYGDSIRSLIGAVVFGGSMLCLFVCSCLYHGTERSDLKKLLRVLDHCTVWIAVAGTYTPYLLRLYAQRPVQAQNLLLLLWSAAALGVMLNFINMERLKHLLYGVCILLGTGMMVKIIQYASSFHTECIKISLAAGFFIAVGVIMYNIGSRHRWFHSVFHIFVLASCGLFYGAVLFYLI